MSYEWTLGVSGWIVITHKSYGRWDWFRQLQRADAWMRHCRATDSEKRTQAERRALVKMIYALPVYRNNLTAV